MAHRKFMRNSFIRLIKPLVALNFLLLTLHSLIAHAAAKDFIAVLPSNLKSSFSIAFVYNLTFSGLVQSRNPVFSNVGVSANTGAAGGLFACAGTLGTAGSPPPGLMFAAA